jgi:hypothetical protein
LLQSEHFGEIALVSEKKLEPVTVKAVERAGATRKCSRLVFSF